MSNASSPRQAGGQGGPSPSAQGQPVRYNPYTLQQAKNGMAMPQNGVRQMMHGGMMAMANNGQLIMANQVQIANPAAQMMQQQQIQQQHQQQHQQPHPLQARLTNPYIGGVQMGGVNQMMMGGGQLMPSNHMYGGQQVAQMLPNGQLVMAGGGGMQMMSAGQKPGHPMGAMVMQMPQMQYIQPPMGQSGQTGVAYQSQPVTYQSQQLSQPPPPPAGNPPKDSDQQNPISRSSTPQTTVKSETANDYKGNTGGGAGSVTGAPSSGTQLGPDFNELNERLQNANKEHRADISRLQKENQKLREKVKKLSRENHAATKSYTVKDGKCPFCLQEMPNKNKKT